ncbi:hypothetical protein [uncultured Megasphaera sp.]|uniref:hypothetical protein n=1 Tax=uncultured Megasphaera sp. TaxID=165188 RepID=UPI0025953D29|nr:hypothetical protein [uncultured Megasphaera sp.]
MLYRTPCRTERYGREFYGQRRCRRTGIWGEHIYSLPRICYTFPKTVGNIAHIQSKPFPSR